MNDTNPTIFRFNSNPNSELKLEFDIFRVFSRWCMVHACILDRCCEADSSLERGSIEILFRDEPSRKQ